MKNKHGIKVSEENIKDEPVHMSGDVKRESFSF